MTDHPVHDSVATPLEEPSATAGEQEMLLFALERVRRQFAWKTGGLDTAGLRRPHPPSRMTLGQIVKHMAQVEEFYVARDVTRRPPGAPWPADAGWDHAWRTADEDSPEELYALWHGAVSRSRSAWDVALADGGLDQPSKHVLDDGTSVNLRRVVVDLIEEYLRHTGHADLFREAVDGLVGNDPPQR
jgi:Protein of unknown function (DUF664)